MVRVPGVVRHCVDRGQFDAFLPAVLSEETPTFTPERTDIALCDKDLCVYLFYEFAALLGRVVWMAVRTFEVKLRLEWQSPRQK